VRASTAQSRPPKPTSAVSTWRRAGIASGSPRRMFERAGRTRNAPPLSGASTTADSADDARHAVADNRSLWANDQLYQA
jgi:hypothetical protein